jgi:hypothetical protein
VPHKIQEREEMGRDGVVNIKRRKDNIEKGQWME